MTEFVNKWKDYIEWEEYFMSLAVLASKRSKDQDFRVGACIVNESSQIVGIGYNGMPTLRENDNDDNQKEKNKMKPKKNNDTWFSWLKTLSKEDLKNKHLYVCHAELNAIAFKTSADVKDCTMYVTLFPCNECAKLIAQSKIKKVIYLSDEKKDKIEFKAGRKILETVGVELVQYQPTKAINVDMVAMLKQAEKQPK